MPNRSTLGVWMHPPRLGPRPLPLHLLFQATSLLSSLAALPNWKNGSLNLKNPRGQGTPEDERLALEKQLGQLNAESWPLFSKAVTDEAARRHRRFIEGIAAYRRNSYHRPEQTYPVLWQHGTTKLLDCRRGGEGDAPVLLIPSLINRAYILDFTPRTSMVRGLGKRGVAPFLLDWGAPGEEEKDFTLTDYVVQRIEPALQIVSDLTGRPVSLLGYCMGGLLALATALRCPKTVAGMVLMAVPWDFHRGFEVPRAFLGPLWDQLRQLIETQGQMPVDILQTLFTTVDPDATARKFSMFRDLRPRSGVAKEFILLEDWVNDGVPLVAKVALECLQGWYLDNNPPQGFWQIAGQGINPADVVCPSMVLIPDRDRIVTSASALALSQALPNSTEYHVNGGHVGMLLSRLVGSRIHAPIASCIKNWAGAAAQK